LIYPERNKALAIRNIVDAIAKELIAIPAFLMRCSIGRISIDPLSTAVIA